MSKYCERFSGSAPESLDQLGFKRGRRQRSLSCVGTDGITIVLLTAFCLALLLVDGLDGCATYRPEPLEPSKVAQQFDGRSMSDPGLCQYLKSNPDTNLSSCPPPQWNLATLTLVGFYYSPNITVADARVREADAAVITARAVPNPTVP